MLLQLDAFHLSAAEHIPAVRLGDRLFLAGERCTLGRHLQKEQGGELLEVVLVGEAVVAQDLAIGPEF